VTDDAWVADLRHGLAAGEFWPAFQPQLNLANGHVCGFEVLARWDSPRHGRVSPATFIPLAERSGLLHTLFIRLLDEACREAATWPGQFSLAFNLAPGQFLLPTLVTDLVGTVRNSGFPLERVVIEITENELFHDNAAVQQVLDDLKQYGMALSLDDFGTGYSSLTRLHSLPFDEIKIDASFVAALSGDAQSLRIVTAVLGLGQSLGLTVVAEGVETTEQAAVLRKLGCDAGQGFLWSPGVPALQALQLLQQWGGEAAEASMDLSPFQRLHQLEALYQDSPVGLCFIDCQMRIVSANPRLASYLGVGLDSMLRKPASQLFGHEMAPDLMSVLVRVMAGEICEAAEYRHQPSGTIFLIAHQLIADAQQLPLGVSLVIIDITSRVEAETRLRQSETHFRTVLELGPNVTWRAGPDGQVDYMGEYVDCPADASYQERHLCWLARMHPEDRLRVRETWLAHLPSRQPFRIEFRILWPDGSWRWMRSRAFPALDDAGDVQAWYGIISDVSTEHELALRVSMLEQQLRERQPSPSP